jgi:hypothetical protein
VTAGLSTGIDVDQVESDLIANMSPKEVADRYKVPIADVAAIFHRLREDGHINANAGGRAASTPSRPVSIPDRPRHTPAEDVKARIASATELLVRADGITDKRIQGALARARKAMTDLAGLVTMHEQQSEARTKIAALEAELASAKAALRNRQTPPRSASTSPAVDWKAVRAWAKANGVECSATGKVSDTVVQAYTAAQQ